MVGRMRLPRYTPRRWPRYTLRFANVVLRAEEVGDEWSAWELFALAVALMGGDEEEAS